MKHLTRNDILLRVLLAVAGCASLTHSSNKAAALAEEARKAAEARLATLEARVVGVTESQIDELFLAAAAL